MDAPPVQYVKTSDGYDIAYTVTGTGQPFINIGVGLQHVQLVWQIPTVHRWLEALADRFKLVQLDLRGTGMSTRGLPPDHSMDSYILDIDAVVNHLKLDDFVLCGGIGHLTFIAVQYAIRHADDVAALILVGPGAELRGPSLFTTVSIEDWDLFLHGLIALSGGVENREQSEQLVELHKQTYRPEDFFLLTRMGAERAPLDELLTRVRTPTLVVQPRDYSLFKPEEPMKVARLTQGRMVTIDGRSPLNLDVEQFMRAVEAFVSDLPEPGTAAATTSIPDLSDRELEVLHLLAQGKSNPQIAEELFITRNTVQNHVSSILIKLNLQNRAQAAVYAKEHGIV